MINESLKTESRGNKNTKNILIIMQPWQLPSSCGISSTNALANAVLKSNKKLIQITNSNNKQTTSKKESTSSSSSSWWLPALSAELADLFSSPSSSKQQQQQKVTLVVCSDSNAAAYLAQSLASSSKSTSFISATMLSVIRNRQMTLDFAKKHQERTASSSTSNSASSSSTPGKLESEYMTLLRLAAAGRGLSTSAVTNNNALVVITTVESLASRSRAVLNAPYLEKTSGADLDDDVKSTKSVNNAEALAATLSTLCDGCDLVCLPGVDKEFAEACQSMTSNLVFISSGATSASSASASKASTKKPAPKAKKASSSATSTSEFFDISLASPNSSSTTAPNVFVPHPELEPTGIFTWHFDDELTTLLLCCNNVPSFLKRLRIMHDGLGQNIENALAAALLSAWGSSSSFALHIRLAHIFRHLLDRSGSIDKETGEIRSTEGSSFLTLRVQASRAISIVASKAEPLSSPACQELIKNMTPRSVASTNPNSSSAANANVAGPFLFRAICSFAVGVAPHAALDKLCDAWAVGTHLIAGTSACKQAKRKQGAMIHTLRMRYQTAHGDAEVGFVEFICHMLVDQISKMAAVTVGEVRSWLMWDVFFGPIYGRLSKFLRLIGILRASTKSAGKTSILASEDEDENENDKNNNSKDQKKNKQQKKAAINAYNFDEDLYPVDTAEDNKLLLLIPRGYKTAPLTTKQLPLHTAHARKEQMLHEVACEEILSAMPQKKIPMYIGDVGNLIGAWTKFNSKYEGRLGFGLTDFMLEHPEKFRVMNNLVLRVTESKHAPVRVRFDNTTWDDNDDDDDDFGTYGSGAARGMKGDERSKKQRKEDEEIAKSGGKSKIHTQRQRKKAVKAARNRNRFNKNKKDIAQDAKVPGYRKPSQKKITGRGKKTNARSWKRQIG